MTEQLKPELQTDIELVLECLNYQKDDAGTVKQSLITLSAILQQNDAAKDIFRECGGLEQVMQLVTSTKCSTVVESGLYCLGSAVAKNVYSQKALSTAGMFLFLHGIFSSQKSSTKKKQTATFLALCLVSNNGFGQNLIRQSSCLHDILSLVRTLLPKNVRQLAATGFQGGMEESSVDLWSALVSTLCACVNNPLNEENQKICASLFPYLFNLLGNGTDGRIVTPLLSLLGLSVSGNAFNQDRVRKCGGFEIFIKKLNHIVALGEKAGSRVLCQLLGTVDASITENELSAKRFGQLGGLKTVCQLLSRRPMTDSDKTQAALTLAHAVEACGDNVEQILEGGGMTVLIQQLTKTMDEELSKTIKYLLHLCVPQGESNIGETENHNTDVSSEEALKRRSDMEMLRKIQELDDKLKSLEKGKELDDKLKSLEKGRSECDMALTSPEPMRVGRSRSAVQVSPYAELEHSAASLYSGHSHQDCPTPREQSLLQQLITEKLEREKLEKLNHMLQESICMTRTAMTGSMNSSVDANNNSTETLKNVGITEKSTLNCTVPYVDMNSNLVTVQSCSTESERRKCGRETSVPLFYSNDLKQNINSVNSDLLKKYLGMNAIDAINNNCEKMNAERVSSRKDIQALDETEQNDLVKTDNRNKQVATKYCDASIQYTQNENDKMKNNENKSSSLNNSQKLKEKETLIAPKQKRPRTTLNRHAEIQCGTPFVSVSEQEKEDQRMTAKFCNESCQTDFRKTPQVVLKPLEETETVKIVNQFNKNEPGTNSLTQNAAGDRSECSEKKLSPCKANQFKNISNDKIVFFVKPTALPPRSKVRITPIRHTALPIRAEESRRENMNNSANGYESDATFKSDFDMSLVRNIRRAPKSKRMVTSRPDPIVKAIGKPSQVIKSQNNTASIDRHVEGRERNVADKWDVSLLSPDLKQPTVPPRPAFSDCGMRRHVLRSPSSVHPHERRSIDDSGIHSPHVFMRRTSPQTSPVDSNVDGLRSSSDVSDDNEAAVPNISAAVLRSSKKLTYTPAEICLGCPGNMACKGKILNSRTYNIALETDPNTCPFHRKLRQIERLHVHKMKRNKIQQLNLRAKLERQIGVGRGKEYSKESVFNFTSDSTEEVSDDCMSEHRVTQAPCRSQRRRQRLDYTEEEVSNLREGVSVMGKNWNSILTTFNFHPTRTNVDLKDKYKRLMAAEREGTSMGVSTRASRQPKPFSMCEERRLRRGVLKFGYHWKTILTSYTFAKGRSSEDLRNKWRNMHRKK
ncbi:uncharacterized protein LOC128232965 [Mya arenaria]|uniref:uncharacterized protein LOC128232965 n=1 Tax=Mya arenaria TaxID=6604 RepID=UPI0022E0F00E|nr:uncharacterized protein LOC128232965 [Mya arenaria]